MKKTKPMLYSALLLTAVNLILRLVATGFQVYLSGTIGAAGIGLMQLVLSTGGLAMTIGIAGIRTTTMYLSAEELGKRRPGNVPWILSGSCLYSICFSIATGLTLFLLAPMISLRWIGHPESLHAIRLLAAFLPVNCLCGVMTGYFTAAKRIGTLAAVEICEQFCSMVITVLILRLWAGSNPAKACQAVVIGSGTGALLTLTSLTVLRTLDRPSPGKKIPTAHRIRETALPLALADNLKAGISTAENLMVPKRLGLCQAEPDPLARFGMVCGMVFPILMFPAAILFALAELLIPELAQCAAAGNHKRIHHLIKRSLRMAMLYGILCATVEFLFANMLTLWMYHDTTAGIYLRWFAPLTVMLYCDIITDAIIKGLGGQKRSVRINILTSALDLILLFILLPIAGIKGYYLSFLITHLINLILSLRYLMIMKQDISMKL